MILAMPTLMLLQAIWVQKSFCVLFRSELRDGQATETVVDELEALLAKVAEEPESLEMARASFGEAALSGPRRAHRALRANMQSFRAGPPPRRSKRESRIFHVFALFAWRLDGYVFDAYISGRSGRDRE